jgi:hypothetical protein
MISLKLRTYRYNMGPISSVKGATKIKDCQERKVCNHGISIVVERRAMYMARKGVTDLSVRG